jgi:predicted acylesterase/phospholipase RssA
MSQGGDDPTVVNGVFEGGGAKGVAYVGALRAAEEAGVRFGAVAGSSAGAITAALVACGYDSVGIERVMRDGLRSFGGRARAALSLHRRSLLSSERLRRWLSRVITEELDRREGPNRGRDRTFTDLLATTGISLYVVTTDLATGQPLVFSPSLTPDASVADAVVASSAIPVAFPAMRVRIGDEVHRLADGGVWANYPSFVFLDDDFRTCHGLPAVEASRPTVGFVLEEVRRRGGEQGQSALAAVRSLSGPPATSDRGAAARELGVVGGLLTSPVTRLSLLLAPLLLVVLGVRQVRSGITVVDSVPDRYRDLALVLVSVVVSLMVVFPCVGLYLVVRVGRSLLDEGAVGARAAMGVGPTVPYWIGYRSADRLVGSRHHVVVRLPVPEGLGTLSFGAGDPLRATAIARARDATLQRLHEAGFSGALTTPVAAGRPTVGPGVRTVGRSRLGRYAWTVVWWVFLPLAWAAMVALTASSVHDAQKGRTAWWQLVGLFALGVAAFVFHGFRRHGRAVAAAPGVRRLPGPVLPAAGILAGLAGLFFLVAGSVPGNVATIIDRAYAERIEARVVGAERVRVDELYEWNLAVEVSPTDDSPFEPTETARDVSASLEERCGEGCFVFEATDEHLGVQSLWYVQNRGIVLTAGERWIPDPQALLQVLALPCFLMAQRCGSAYLARRRDRRHSTRRAASVGAPLPPPTPGRPPAAAAVQDVAVTGR